MTSCFNPRRRRTVLALAIALAVVFSPPLAAQALDLDRLKAQGVVGERIDGYAAPVGDAPADVVSFVNEINAKRRARYADIAASNGTSAAAVGQITGEKVIERAPSGTYVMGADGRWQQK